MLLIKKIVFCVVAICVTAQISIAQSYYHTPNDTIIANAVFDDVGVFNILLNHTANDTLLFKWKKLSVILPSSWEASICDVGHCYSTIVDSSESDPIYPGDIGIISLHLNPHTEAGIGVVRVLFWENHTPTIIDTLTWIISANGFLGLTDNYKNAITFYPNPAAQKIILETNIDEEYTCKIINQDGIILGQNSFYQKNSELDISHLPIGIYELQLIYNQKIIIKKFIKR